MRLTTIILISTFLQVAARSHAQTISLSLTRVPVQRVFKELSRQTGISIVYSEAVMATPERVTIHVKDATVSQVLDECLRDLPFYYSMEGKTIVIKNKPAKAPPTQPLETPPPPVEVRGRVSNDKGEPLAGATIQIKGSKKYVVTAADGSFSIEAPGNRKIVLIASYVGMETQEIAAGDDGEIAIRLKPANASLSDFVVVGYGTSRKKDITGSVASVAMNEQEKTPVIGTEQLLEGRVSGVQITQNQSQPGAVFSVRIRGTNSINSSSSPLFVVDGYAGGNGGDLNPSDILSIDVLKDASATAIYGSRGANGVVIITTKRGSLNATKITLDAYTGVQQIGKKYKMMDAQQYGNFANTVAQEDNDLNGTSNPLPFTAQQISALGKGTDWQDAIFRKAGISNYSIAFNGGNPDSRHYLSFNFFDQKGIITGSDYKRGIVRFNLDQNISSRLKIGLSSQIGYSYQNMTTVNTSGGADQPSVLWDAVRFNPMLPVKDSSGAYTYVNGPAGVGAPIGNPVAYINEAKDGFYNLNVFLNAFGEYEILKGLKFRTSFGANYVSTGEELFVPTDIFASSGIGRAMQSSQRNYNWLNENTLTYDREFNKIHVINLTGGFTLQNWYSKTFSAGITNLSTNNLGPYNFGIGIPATPTSYYGENALVSYFGRANYRLMDKYLFTFTMRADGSSRFGTNDKWGYFPSGAFAWHLSQENFIKNIQAVSDLKLRMSYGITGNQEIGSYNSLSQFVSNQYSLGSTPSLVVGVSASNIANPSLKWESTASSDVGLDLGLWNNRLYITTDFYYKKTSNLLLLVNIPITSGYSSILQNAGAVSNKGFEFSATSLNIDQKKVKWTTTVNFSTNANKVLNLGSNKQIYVGQLSGSVFNGGAPSSAILEPGKPIGSFYGYVFDGIWQSQAQITKSGTTQMVSPGDPIYKDLNNDSSLSGDDRTILGQAMPKFIYGIINNITVGRFNLNIFFQGVYGNKILNENLYEIQNGTPDFNKLAYVGTESWHGPGTSNTLPRVSSILRNATGFTSDVLENGSFLRLKTITLSYNLPLPQLTSVFKSANIYVTAQNLLTFTKYSGYDPEVNSFTDATDALSLGTDYNAFPNYKTFLVGVKFGF
jgi:TonB-dependent starch-binding outer membrane protein SusC